ncbi:hypothetical protein MC378_05650 [Polaribacter sp. MSW13]|uniref:Outer membrane protein beta-barrel domain-containing protein n=1 Tax=Polaribacter marinus TaxID=2916838 RepID=A0A9X2AM76_9FLAO|nr:hypothetical protein [Polaribacter marinus]MCI2228644.1 hypothetical protein [Polaribacter marinus]
MKKKFCFFITGFLFFSISVNSQNSENEWSVSLGAGLAIYSEADGRIVNGRYISQLPRVTLAKYMSKNITLVGGVSVGFKDEVQSYTTIDGAVRFSFGTSENKFSPYAILGGSFIKANGDIVPTLNFGGGATYWITDRFGIQGQLTYKLNGGSSRTQRSHIFGSGGIVYRFSMSLGAGGPGRNRVWD